MRETEVKAKTVQKAVEKGLKDLGLARDQVEVAILDEGSGGFLGLGARPARVTIREKKWVGEAKAQAPQRQGAVERPRREGRRDGPSPAGQRPHAKKPAPQAEVPAGARDSGTWNPPTERAAPPRTRREEHLDPASIQTAVEEGKSVVAEMLSLMGIPAEGISATWDPRQSRVKVDVQTRESRIMIGREGKVLESIQYLATLIVSRKQKPPVAVQVDTQGYWKNKEERILSQVKKVAENVKRTGKVFRLEPMDPAARRFVHKALADYPDVDTVSEGEGPWRKVILKPKRKSGR